MSLFIASLNSGSNGNCYYIGNANEAVLIDAGISCRETEKRMLRLGLSIRKVKAIFISHEHSDHISGVPVLSRKYQIPVYVTTATKMSCGLMVDDHLAFPFQPFENVVIGDLNITAFPKQHDARHPHSFIVASSSTTIGIFTDIGIACANVINHFKRCHAAFLEANYDDEMLDKGSYPFHLKRRIRGGNGHLSNKQAVELFLNHRPPFMTHLLLAHLSKNNNDPELVQRLFDECAGGVNVVVASRFKESEVYHIKGVRSTQERAVERNAVQVSLF
jgi:phosphoribosyl 1,2-cyclic phosphodiesterase